MIRRLLEFNSSRKRLFLENKLFAGVVPAGSLVLDAGAGDGPYRSLFAHARFDFVVFNQVMEHLPEPGRVVSELFRVLKPSGKMIYTGPLFFEEHEQPYDFYRYTRFGVRHIFERAGFVVERLDWLEGLFGTAGYSLSALARFLPLKPREMRAAGALAWCLCPALFFLKALFAVLSVIFHRLEMAAKCTDRGFPKNYVAILSKPESIHPVP